MTAPLQRPSERGVFQNHESRLGKLEAALPSNPRFEVLIGAPEDPVTVADNQAEVFIARDMNNMRLIDAAAGVFGPSSSGDVTVDLKYYPGGTSMLLTPITITPSNTNSYIDGNTPIDPGNSQVFLGDFITIDVLTDGTDATGLIVALTFGFV